MNFDTIFNKFIALIYPKRCLFCDCVLDFNSPSFLCAHCKGTVHYLTSGLCNKCGKPHDTQDDLLCHDCARRDHTFHSGRGMWLYEGKVKKAIHTYKYHLRKSHGKAFAQELHQFYTKHVGWEVDVITCVPLHPSKMKERSFNQAAYLATLLGEKLGIKVDNNLLIRTKNTRPQKDLTDLERIINVENAFEMNKESECQRQRILLVDDIYTTGSTVDNCAKILIQHGAKEVNFLTLAIGKGY